MPSASLPSAPSRESAQSSAVAAAPLSSAKAADVTAEPVTPSLVALPPVAQANPVEAEPEVEDVAASGPPTKSLRPKQRPTSITARATEQRPTPKPQPTAAQPAPRGNAQANAARGQRAGTAQGKTADSNAAAKSTAKQAGTSALRSYKSAVLRRVARTRAPNAGDRGSVLVQIRIGTSGALANASVAKSSGSSRVDRAALQTVNRAGPFGPPPGNNPVTYTIRIDVRG